VFCECVWGVVSDEWEAGLGFVTGEGGDELDGGVLCSNSVFEGVGAAEGGGGGGGALGSPYTREACDNWGAVWEAGYAVRIALR